VALEFPLFLQAREYPARLVRQMISALAAEGVIDHAANGFKVSERALGANFTVDVAAGFAVIDGDDTAEQGSYLVRSTAVESVVIPAAPVTANTSRIDLVVLRINDATAGGPAGDLAELEVVQGVEAVAPAVAAVPATPTSAIVLARVAVSNLSASIANAAITDVRPEARPRLVASYASLDDLPDLFTQAEAAALFDPLGAADAEVAAHELAANPHPQYLTDAEGDALFVTPAEQTAALAAYIAKSIVDAAGDLIVGTAADTVARLAKGGALTYLRVNAAATALEWAALSGGAQIATGTYTGDGSSPRTIPLAFTPKLVVVGRTDSDGASLIFGPSTDVGSAVNLPGSGSATQSSANGTTTNGFIVNSGTSTDGNWGSISYRYIAIG
jgi:hypothetical protein